MFRIQKKIVTMECPNVSLQSLTETTSSILIYQATSTVAMSSIV